MPIIFIQTETPVAAQGIFAAAVPKFDIDDLAGFTPLQADWIPAFAGMTRNVNITY